MPPIEWTDPFVGVLEAASKSQQELVWLEPGRQIRDPRGGEECLDGVSYLNSSQQEGVKVTKTAKAIVAGPAFAGLFAGTGASPSGSAPPDASYLTSPPL